MGCFQIRRFLHRATTTTLRTLTFSPASATSGSAWSATISGATAASTITATSSDGTTLTVTGSGTTRNISGTFSANGAPTVSMVETLAGAVGSPKTSTQTVTVASVSTLANLTIAPTSATATSAWNANISGCATGSTVTAVSSDGTTLTVIGTGTTRSVSGTFAAAGTPTVTLTETLAGATNTPHTSPAITVTVAAAGSNFIPSIAALNAMLSAGVGASGGKTYTLAAIDFGIRPLYGTDFSANPIVLQGTWTGDIATSTRFQWMEIAGAKGITLKNFNVYGSNGSQWAVAIEGNCQDLIFDGVTIINATAVEGTPADGKGLYMNGNLSSTNIQFIGQNDATKPDIWGFGNAINIQESAHVLIKNVTLGNNGTDHCLLYGVDNCTLDGILTGTVYWNAPDHADFIQTDQSNYRPAGTRNNNMTIKNCGVQRPPGLLGSQGYFVAQTNGLVMQNNWAYDAYGNSMSITLCDTVSATNNFMQPVNDVGNVSAITTRAGSSNVTINNNYAYSIDTVSSEGPYPGYSASGNTILTPVNPGDYAALDAWLAANPTARRRHSW